MNRNVLTLAASVLLGGVSLAARAEPPANVGKTVQAAMAYYESGAYQRAYDAVMTQALRDLGPLAARYRKPAIVLDIDETTLSNWAELRANHFAYFEHGACDRLPQGPCGDDSWAEKGEAPIFAAAKTLIDEAQKRHVAVFFLTGRDESHRAALERNLTREGVSGWAGLIMRPLNDRRTAAAYKTPVRARLEAQGYTIVENIGDQPGDLEGGHALRGYRLPNPFYSVP